MLFNQVKPSEDQMKRLMGYPKDTPLVMINILKFKAKTDNGKESGKEAYARYFRNAKPFIAHSNAKLIWKGAVAATVIGDSEKEPDMIFMVEYPSVDHFVRMVSDPEYQKIANDRTIALEYGGLIACQSLK